MNAPREHTWLCSYWKKEAFDLKVKKKQYMISVANERYQFWYVWVATASSFNTYKVLFSCETDPQSSTTVLLELQSSGNGIVLYKVYFSPRNGKSDLC